MITNTKFRQQNKTNKAKNTLIVGIDILWVRPNKVGGSESYIRNLLQGFKFYSPDGFFFMLFVSKDNIESFQEYIEKPNFKIIKCEIKSSNIVMRIVWENIYLDKFAVKHNVDVMFIPVYSMPLKNSSIPYVVTIHDLQALHYPEYFSKLKNLWMRLSWRYSIKSSNKIIAISKFVSEDIKTKFGVSDNKIEVIYNPIKLSEKHIAFEVLRQKYNIMSMEYLYTVASMLPHKNLKVLLQLLVLLKNNPIQGVPHKLVISGVGGKQEEEIKLLINKLGIAQDVIITGFVSNEERDSLYKYAYAFLFPSLFEGFGMPPIEAMMLGTPVITTRCASIPEVTRGKAIYVDDPYDASEWYEKLKEIKNCSRKAIYFPEYEMECVVNKYYCTFRKILA